MSNRRIIYRQFGESDVLELETSEPRPPKPRCVIVKMAGAGLNPIDFKTRKGLGFVAAQISDKLPWCPGYDLAGEVVEVGEKTARWKKGDKVYGMVGFPLTGGAYSEYVEVAEASLCRAPTAISLSEAGGVPLAALTAWQALFVAGNLQSGSRVLIHAAAGGVGHFAVQFAKAIACEVIATASAENHEFLKALGVDDVIDYRKQDFTQACKDVDFVLDSVGAQVGEKSLGLINKGGQLVTVPTITAQQIIDAGSTVGVRVSGLTVEENIEQLVKITEMIDAGIVTVNIDRTYSLDNVKEAHIFLEKGHTRGKLILIP